MAEVNSRESDISFAIGESDLSESEEDHEFVDAQDLGDRHEEPVHAVLTIVMPCKVDQSKELQSASSTE